MLTDDPLEGFSRGPDEVCLVSRRRDGSLATAAGGWSLSWAGDGRRRRGMDSVDLSSGAEDWSEELLLACRVLVWDCPKGWC